MTVKNVKLSGGMPQDENYNAVPVMHPRAISIKLDGTSASVASDVISASENKVVRIAAIDQIWVAFGAAPTAVADTCMLMFTESSESFTIYAGEKIAVLGGVANLTIME